MTTTCAGVALRESKLYPGSYQLRGTVMVRHHGHHVAVPVVYQVFRSEAHRGWLFTTDIDGFRTLEPSEVYARKADAVAAVRAQADRGYQVHPYLGLCGE